MLPRPLMPPALTRPRPPLPPTLPLRLAADVAAAERRRPLGLPLLRPPVALLLAAAAARPGPEKQEAYRGHGTGERARGPRSRAYAGDGER
jgi:hypothetical protein